MALIPIAFTGFGAGGGGGGTPNFISGNYSATAAVSKAVTAGNLVIVVGVSNGGAVTPSISDGVNSWTPITGSPFQDASNAFTYASWWAIAATSASITATTSSNGTSPETMIGEWSGVAAASPTDGANFVQDQPGSVTANAVSTGSVNTAADGDLIISYIICAQVTETATEFAAGTGFTKCAGMSHDPGSPNDTAAVQWKVQTTHGAINPTWTQTVADVYDGFTAAFKHS